jgi:hypothetical protein
MLQHDWELEPSAFNDVRLLHLPEMVQELLFYRHIACGKPIESALQVFRDTVVRHNFFDVCARGGDDCLKVSVKTDPKSFL